MTELDGIGEAMTGAAAGRALEPVAGEAAHQHRDHGHSCLNCSTPLVGPHCHQCGQAGHVHRTVSAWWHDLVHGVLHLDGKIWRTLPLLAWRPGDLTRRYIEGERAKFVSPLALFLASVFLMFAVFGALGATGGGFDPAEIESGMAEEVAQEEAKLADLRREREAAAAAGSGADLARLDAKIAQEEKDLDLLRTMKERGMVQGSSMRLSDDVPAWLAKPIKKAAANPSLFFYKVQTNAYKFSWALIPLSVPFVWLLLLHRRRYRRAYKAYDHLVFVTYSIAFMSLFIIALVLARQVGLPGGAMLLLLCLVPPLHMYRQLRGAYCLSRARAAWRALLLVNFASVAMTLFFLLLLTLGLLG
jgi:hypothetical protein